jgi:hypothetical protein
LETIPLRDDKDQNRPNALRLSFMALSARDSSRKIRNGSTVLDIVMLVLVVICFALAQAYTSLCDDLLAVPPDRADKDSTS